MPCCLDWTLLNRLQSKDEWKAWIHGADHGLTFVLVKLKEHASPMVSVGIPVFHQTSDY